MCDEIAPANANFSIRDSFENLENITDVSDGQFQKEFVQLTSTEAGISIQSKPLGSNGEFSIRDNRESMSKRTDESEMDKEEHFSQITSTEPGMWIDFRPLPENADASRRCKTGRHSKTPQRTPSREEKLFSQIGDRDDGIHARWGESTPSDGPVTAKNSHGPPITRTSRRKSRDISPPLPVDESLPFAKAPILPCEEV
jgi:hypothetical protein